MCTEERKVILWTKEKIFVLKCGFLRKGFVEVVKLETSMAIEKKYLLFLF